MASGLARALMHDAMLQRGASSYLHFGRVYLEGLLNEWIRFCLLCLQRDASFIPIIYLIAFLFSLLSSPPFLTARFIAFRRAVFRAREIWKKGCFFIIPRSVRFTFLFLCQRVDIFSKCIFTTATDTIAQKHATPLVYSSQVREPGQLDVDGSSRDVVVGCCCRRCVV